MTIPTRGTLADRCWTAFVPRPSTLRRPSDRAETVARWVALVLLVVAVPFLLAYGSGSAQAIRDQAARDRAVSHPVVATVTGVTLLGRAAGGVPAGGVEVTATWKAPDGSTHTVTGMSPQGARVGDPWTGWVDAAGNQVRPPTSDSEATTDGVLIAFWVFLGLATGLAGLLGLLHRVLDRHRMRDWDEDWALFGLGRNRGTSA